MRVSRRIFAKARPQNPSVASAKESTLPEIWPEPNPNLVEVNSNSAGFVGDLRASALHAVAGRRQGGEARHAASLPQENPPEEASGYELVSEDVSGAISAKTWPRSTHISPNPPQEFAEPGDMLVEPGPNLEANNPEFRRHPASCPPPREPPMLQDVSVGGVGGYANWKDGGDATSALMYVAFPPPKYGRGWPHLARLGT